MKAEHPTATPWVNMAAASKRIDGVLPRYFSVLPRQPFTIVPVPRELEEGYTTARGVGVRGELDLVTERTFRLGLSLVLLRLSDLAVAAFLSLSHGRTSFR